MASFDYNNKKPHDSLHLLTHCSKVLSSWVSSYLHHLGVQLPVELLQRTPARPPAGHQGVHGLLQRARRGVPEDGDQRAELLRREAVRLRRVGDEDLVQPLVHARRRHVLRRRHLQLHCQLDELAAVEVAAEERLLPGELAGGHQGQGLTAGRRNVVC